MVNVIYSYIAYACICQFDLNEHIVGLIFVFCFVCGGHTERVTNGVCVCHVHTAHQLQPTNDTKYPWEIFKAKQNNHEMKWISVFMQSYFVSRKAFRLPFDRCDGVHKGKRNFLCKLYAAGHNKRMCYSLLPLHRQQMHRCTLHTAHERIVGSFRLSFSSPARFLICESKESRMCIL